MQTSGIKTILFNIQLTLIGGICVLLGSFFAVAGLLLIVGSFVSSVAVLSKKE